MLPGSLSTHCQQADKPSEVDHILKKKYTTSENMNGYPKVLFNVGLHGHITLDILNVKVI